MKIGDGAYIGSGSVITKNVAAGALALERSAQEERPGWAAKFRAMMAKRKAKPVRNWASNSSPRPKAAETYCDLSDILSKR